MGIEAIVMLVARYGPTAAEQIYNLIRKAVTEHGDPTPEDWAALRAMVNNTIAQRLAEPPP